VTLEESKDDPNNVTVDCHKRIHAPSGGIDFEGKHYKAG